MRTVVHVHSLESNVFFPTALKLQETHLRLLCVLLTATSQVFLPDSTNDKDLGAGHHSGQPGTGMAHHHHQAGHKDKQQQILEATLGPVMNPWHCQQRVTSEFSLPAKDQKFLAGPVARGLRYCLRHEFSPGQGTKILWAESTAMQEM